MLFRYFCLQASLLVWRASLVVSVEVDSRIRCQKSGCRSTEPDASSPDGRLRGSRANGPSDSAPEAPPTGPRSSKPLRALVCEWLAVFAVVRLLSSVRHGVGRGAAPGLRATAAAAARAFDDACTAWVAALRRPRKAGARRRAAAAAGSSASLGSLADLVGSDDVSNVAPSSDSVYSSGETEFDSAATSNYTYDHTIIDSEATTVPRITTRAARKTGPRVDSFSEDTTVPRITTRAARKRGPVADSGSEPSSASSSSMCGPTSSRRRVRGEVRTNAVARKKKAERERPLAEVYYESSYCESDTSSSYSSSGCDTSESSAEGYASSESIVSRMLDYLTVKMGTQSTKGATPGGGRGRRSARGDDSLGKAYTRPLRYGGRQRRMALDAFPHGNGMSYRYAAGQEPI